MIRLCLHMFWSQVLQYNICFQTCPSTVQRCLVLPLSWVCIYRLVRQRICFKALSTAVKTYTTGCNMLIALLLPGTFQEHWGTECNGCSGPIPWLLKSLFLLAAYQSNTWIGLTKVWGINQIYSFSPLLVKVVKEWVGGRYRLCNQNMNYVEQVFSRQWISLCFPKLHKENGKFRVVVKPRVCQGV